MSLLLLIRTGQRFRSPVSPFIIISSHSFAKVYPIPLFALQRLLTKKKKKKGEKFRLLILEHLSEAVFLKSKYT